MGVQELNLGVVNGEETAADFEAAITAAKWGKFHIMVYFISIFCCWSSVFEATSMSYVLPAAECDLNLSLEDKGLLNAILYAGMICTGFLWGYLSDILGRKKLLVIGLLLDGIFVLLCAFSQNFTMLMIAKFLSGSIINGPFSAISTYLPELHCSSQRSRAQFLIGILYSLGTIALPFLAIFILPLQFTFNSGDSFALHSWNLYLLICGSVPLTGAILFAFLPESPKFLMTIGKNDEALKVFRKIYAINTGKAAETYPIKVLVDEIALNEGKNMGKITANRTKSEAFLEGFQQMKPLFHSPFLRKIIIVCLFQCFIMSSLNTLRLWLPQLFQAINDYELKYNSSATLCNAIAVFTAAKTEQESFSNVECVVNNDNISVYINSIIVASVTIGANILGGSMVNKTGKKNMLMGLSIIGGFSVFSLYFSMNTLTTIILSSVFIAAGSVMINTMLAVVVEMFPTTLRTMAVSLLMSTGRAGSVLGNSLYPLLLTSGCVFPFIYDGLLCLGCGLLLLMLPVTEFSSLT